MGVMKISKAKELRACNLFGWPFGFWCGDVGIKEGA
jgi:uncharacterized membrane protein